MDEWLAEFIKRIVSRMSFAEVIPVLKTWGFLAEKDLQSLILMKSKDRLAMEFVSLCECKKATIDHAADLDIIYYYTNSKKKSWEVYQMSKPSGNTYASLRAPFVFSYKRTVCNSDRSLDDVSKFRLQFKKNVRSVLKNVTIHFREFEGSLWIRIAWGRDCMKPNQYKPTFVVYQTQAPYAFITGCSKSQWPVLSQGLLLATGYRQIQEMELKSRCLKSLQDIVFKRFSQVTILDKLNLTKLIPHVAVPFMSFILKSAGKSLVLNAFSRWENSSGNPDLVALYHEQLFDKPFQSYQSKSIPEKSYKTPAIVDSRVAYENIKEKERIRQVTFETFGDGPLPKLEYASYKLETSFNGEAGIANKIEPFRCLVKFNSPHLLESLRTLAPSGIAEAPISSLLSCIPHRGRNVFKISEKKQPGSSQPVS